MTKESVRQKKAAMIAILAVLLTAFAPFIALGGDVAADGSADLSVYRYTPKLTMTSPNFGDVEYMVWDFGDGTVLDGRWEYYIQQQKAGVELTPEQISGIAAYKELLAKNGNTLLETTHTYAEKGTYTVTAVGLNPLGYKAPGASVPYDGTFNTDETGFDGGMTSTIAKDVKAPSDEDLKSAEFKAVAGSWSRVLYVVEILGYPTITFDTKGGSEVSPIEVENTFEYKPAVKPTTDPTKDGYAFNGWFTDEGCTTPYDWNKNVTEPMTLYAGWLEIPKFDHVITFMDGEVKVGTQNKNNENDGTINIQITQEDPAKDGYTFKGWSPNKDSTSADYVKGDEVSIPVDGLTLYAVWERNVVNVTVDGVPKVFNEGSRVSDIVKPSRPGFEFNGWFSNDTYTNPVSDDTVLTEGMKLFSKMDEIIVPEDKIIVYIDGKNVLMDKGKKVSDIEIPVKEGFRFDGWYYDIEFTDRASDERVLENLMELHSKWIVNVTIDGVSKTFNEGSRVSDIVKPTKDGYTFDGWYSDEGFASEVTEDTILTDGMVLFSKFVKIEEKKDPFNWGIFFSIFVLVMGMVAMIVGYRIGQPAALVIGLIVAILGVISIALQFAGTDLFTWIKDAFNGGKA